MNLRELYIGNMERVQDLLQVGRLVTNKRGGHGLSLVSLETLHLSLLPDMRCIWEGLMPSKLTILKVKECRRLTYVFTDSMITSLVQLEVLKISKCEELEQTIAKVMMMKRIRYCQEVISNLYASPISVNLKSKDATS
jgi:hypothetical protein